MNNKYKNSPEPKLVSSSKNRYVTTKLGEVEKIIQKDACGILETCGSCPLLNLDYKSQIKEKNLRIKEKFKQLGDFFSHIALQHFVESEEKLAYRHSVKLVISEHFVNGRSWIDIGFYRQQLNKIIDIGNCPIQTPILNDIMYFLRSALKTYKIPIYSPRTKKGLLTGVIIRSSQSTKQTFITFLVKDLKPALFRELACSLTEKMTSVQGVFLQNDGHDTNEEPKLIAGTNQMEQTFALTNFKLAHNIELPIHPSMTSKIYTRILELCDLNGSQNVVHLYSGIGVLACLLSRKSKHVYAFDEKVSNAQNTELNIKALHLQNIQLEIGKISPSLKKFHNTLPTCDRFVVTAPRLGLNNEIIATIALYKPKTIVYVCSFNEQLIEDLKMFKQHKYKTIFIEPFDTHPGTQYFETLCFLNLE